MDPAEDGVLCTAVLLLIAAEVLKQLFLNWLRSIGSEQVLANIPASYSSFDFIMDSGVDAAGANSERACQDQTDLNEESFMNFSLKRHSSPVRGRQSQRETPSNEDVQKVGLTVNRTEGSDSGDTVTRDSGDIVIRDFATDVMASVARTSNSEEVGEVNHDLSSDTTSSLSEKDSSESDDDEGGTYTVNDGSFSGAGEIFAGIKQDMNISVSSLEPIEEENMTEPYSVSSVKYFPTIDMIPSDDTITGMHSNSVSGGGKLTANVFWFESDDVVNQFSRPTHRKYDVSRDSSGVAENKISQKGREMTRGQPVNTESNLYRFQQSASAGPQKYTEEVMTLTSDVDASNTRNHMLFKSGFATGYDPANIWQTVTPTGRFKMWTLSGLQC